VHGFYVVAFLILLIIPVVLLVRYQKPKKEELPDQDALSAH
jgi:cytochrome c-type biogenesis protein CcmH/NrfG